jgi:hypothetical protein
MPMNVYLDNSFDLIVYNFLYYMRSLTSNISNEAKKAGPVFDQCC